MTPTGTLRSVHVLVLCLLCGQLEFERLVCSLWTSDPRTRGLSFEDRLIWTLGHPDSDRAMLAAKTLGALRTRGALPTLQRLVDDGRDPFRAVAALRSAIEMAGRDELRACLERHAESESFMVSAVARQALA
jgi:hypothetical protein